jgi:hypothetical protein
MKKEKVRCWEIIINNGDQNDAVFITYPEGSMGHRLISCLNCGEIFSVNVTKELYSEMDFNEKVSSTICPRCDSILGNNYHEYPEKYLSKNGMIYKYDRCLRIPEDHLSIVKEFYEIYS